MYEVVQCYVDPLNTFTVAGSPAADHGHYKIKSCQLNLGVLAHLCEQRFQWTTDIIATNLCVVVWEGALL